MDNLVEQVVKKQKNTKYYLNIFLAVIIAVMIPVTIGAVALIIKRAYMIYIAFFVSLFCIYGAWMYITGLNIDFEYATLGGVFRVDKIIAKRNRKPIIKIDIKMIDDMFKYSDEEMSKRKFNKVYYVGESEYSDDNYVATFISEAKGKCAIVFSPKENTLNALRPHLKREIVKNIF